MQAHTKEYLGTTLFQISNGRVHLAKNKILHESAQWLGSWLYCPAENHMERNVSVPVSGSYTSSFGLHESLSSTWNFHVLSQGVKYLLQLVLSHLTVNREPGGAPAIQFHPMFFRNIYFASSRLFTCQHVIVCTKQMQTASLGETETELPRIVYRPLTRGKILKSWIAANQLKEGL